MLSSVLTARIEYSQSYHMQRSNWIKIIIFLQQSDFFQSIFETSLRLTCRGRSPRRAKIFFSPNALLWSKCLIDCSFVYGQHVICNIVSMPQWCKHLAATEDDDVSLLILSKILKNTNKPCKTSSTSKIKMDQGNITE